MEAPTLKLSPIERLDLMDEVISLAARAIRMQHPDGRALARLSLTALLDVDSVDLANQALALKAWIADREEVGAPADASDGS
jgi:hypothetical protein